MRIIFELIAMTAPPGRCFPRTRSGWQAALWNLRVYGSYLWHRYVVKR